MHVFPNLPRKAVLAMPQYDPAFPVCIDLDGTLVIEHTLWHAHPGGHFPRWTSWLHFSWPKIKACLVEHADLSQTQWTYYAPLMHQMQIWHGQGVKLYLATGAPEKIAHHVAEKIGLFSDVWCSSVHHNLVGWKKAALLCDRFGKGGYTYVGDSWKDRAVWKTSRDIITVAPTKSRLVTYLEHQAQAHQQIYCFS